MKDDAYAYATALFEVTNSNFKAFAKNLTIVRDRVDIERFNSLEERVARIEQALQLRQ